MYVAPTAGRSPLSKRCELFPPPVTAMQGLEARAMVTSGHAAARRCHVPLA